MRTIVLTLGARHSSGHGWQSLSFGSNLDQSGGLAIAAKLLNRNYEVVTCLSDGELQCGVDHQAKLAAAWHLNNLIVLLDNNGLQSNYEVQRVDGTLEGGRAGPRLRALWENYGWDYIEIDGHRYAEIVEAFHFAQRSSRPVIIVAKTLKGKGVPRFEGKFGYDHLASDQEIAEAEAHLKSLVLNKRAAKRLEGPRLDMEPTQAVRSTVVLPNLDARDMSSERMAVPLERWLSQFRD